MVKRGRRQARSLYGLGLRQMSRRPALGLLIIILAFALYWAQDFLDRPTPGPIEESYFQARVRKVSDGDTLTVRTPDGREAKLRLYGLDAPELAQPYGPESGNFLRNLVDGRDIRVERQDVDQYGRLVARIFLDGQPVDLTMIETGQAWVYERYCDRPWCGDLRRRQSLARKNKVGLWREAQPTPPWVWRQKHRR